MMKFTVEESNLICMYNTGTRIRTLAGLRMLLPLIDDPDMRAVTDSAAVKLDNMTDAEFAAIAFEPVPPDAEDEHGGGGYGKPQTRYPASWRRHGKRR